MNGDVIEKGQGGQKYARVDIFDAFKRRMACVIVEYTQHDGLGAYHIQLADVSSKSEAVLSLRVEAEMQKGERVCEDCGLSEIELKRSTCRDCGGYLKL